MTIRRKPSDFEVEELAEPGALRAEAGGSHAVYEVRKESMTTPEAASALARALGVRPGLVEYAGLKDKHAVTTQWMSVPLTDGAGEPPAVMEGSRWSARLVGRSDRPVGAWAVRGNRFRIVIRGLTLRAVREMGRRAALQRVEGGRDGPSTLLVVNYFGEQRFGSSRHGKGWIGRELVAGRFEEALRLAIGTPARKDTGVRRAFARLAAGAWGDWERLAREWPRCPEREAVEVMARTGDARQAFAALPYFLQEMAVDAYQSHLWNRAAARLVETRVPAKDRLASVDPGMVFAAARGVEPALRSLKGALPAPGAVDDGPWGGVLSAVLREEGFVAEELRVPGLRRPAFARGERPLMVEATGFELGRARVDEMDPTGRRLAVEVRLDLPRGAYATVVLRSLGQ